MLESNKKRYERKKREAKEAAEKMAATKQAIIDRFAPYEVPFKDEIIIPEIKEVIIETKPTRLRSPTYAILPDTTISLAFAAMLLILVII